MEMKASLISEELLRTVPLVPTSPQVPYKLRIAQLTCFFTPPSHVSKSIPPPNHTAAGTDLLTHTEQGYQRLRSAHAAQASPAIPSAALEPPTTHTITLLPAQPPPRPYTMPGRFQVTARSSSPPPLCAQPSGIQNHGITER